VAGYGVGLTVPVTEPLVHHRWAEDCWCPIRVVFAAENEPQA
jgi:hypothetical protein